MLKIGLTGGIASGKSAVAQLFRQLGVPVLDTDCLARRAVEPGSAGLAAIVKRFGSAILDSQGQLQRKALRQIIFTDSAARNDLNQILHPEINRLLNEELNKLQQNPDLPLVLVEVPLLYEVGWQDRFDANIVVYVPENIQLDRLQKRDGISLEQARQALAAQWPLTKKKELAQFVIDNSGTLSETQKRVNEVCLRFKTPVTRTPKSH